MNTLTDSLKWISTGINGEKQLQMMEELPHWNLQHLEIENFLGVSCPIWLRSNLLPKLRSLTLFSCHNIQSISFFEPLCHEEVSDNVHPLEDLCIGCCSSLTSIGASKARSVGAFSSLSRLTIYFCGGLLSLDEFLTPAFLPAVKNIHIESCPELMTLPVDKLHGFSSLEEIIIELCPKLNTQSAMRLPSSLQILMLYACGGIETMDFPQLGSSLLLEGLWIWNCPDLRFIDVSINVALTVSEASSSRNVGAFSSLARLTIIGCRGLLSLDEFLTPAYLPAVKNILIESCPELMSLPVDRLHGFSCLEEMTVKYCPKLNTQMVTKLPSSLKKLTLYACGGIESINFCQLGSSPALQRLYIPTRI